MKIGEGASAEIYAWAPGQVVKLFRPGIRRRVGAHEARMTRAVFAAGGPAPRVLAEVMAEGRFGIVLPRLDGPSLFELTRDRVMTPMEAGAIFARLALAVHRTPAPPETVSLQAWMDASLRLANDRVPAPLGARVLDLIDALAPVGTLCHGDLHSSNVIVTSTGPRLIDWTGTMRADAALDLAISQVLLTEIIPDDHDDPERPRAVHAAMRTAYGLMAGLEPERLDEAIALYLPVARALALLGRGAGPEQRKRLTARLEMSLRS